VFPESLITKVNMRLSPEPNKEITLVPKNIDNSIRIDLSTWELEMLMRDLKDNGLTPLKLQNDELVYGIRNAKNAETNKFDLVMLEYFFNKQYIETVKYLFNLIETRYENAPNATYNHEFAFWFTSNQVKCLMFTCTISYRSCVNHIANTTVELNKCDSIDDPSFDSFASWIERSRECKHEVTKLYLKLWDSISAEDCYIYYNGKHFFSRSMYMNDKEMNKIDSTSYLLSLEGLEAA